jgi:hypothetical protein
MGMIAFQVGNNEPAIILKDIKKFPETKPTIWFVVDNIEEEYKKVKSERNTFLLEAFSHSNWTGS